MKIPKITTKQIKEVLGEGVVEENQKPFYDLNNVELKAGDFVVVSRRQCSADWLSYGIVIKNAGYWESDYFHGKLYNDLLLVKCLDGDEVEEEDIEFRKQVLKIDEGSMPKKCVELLRAGS